MKRSLIAGEYTSSRQESVSKHLKLGDGQESAITQNHQNQNQTQNQSRLMASEAAVFASPEGSSHLGPYQPALDQRAEAPLAVDPPASKVELVPDLMAVQGTPTRKSPWPPHGRRPWG